MLHFQYEQHLWWLWAIPALAVVFVLALRVGQKVFARLGDRRLMKMQLLGFIPGRKTTKFLLPLIALALVVIAYANLRKSAGVELAKRKGVDVIIALDISKSMLAKDISPDRLSRAKLLIYSLMQKLKGDRVGLVVFAGRAYLQVPLTVDYSATKLSLQGITTESAPSQGTVIGEAIALATQSFSQKENKYKALVLISDGEDHDATAMEHTQTAVEKGIIIHTVGVGSPQGIQIKDPQTGQPLLDEEGKQVISKLNEPSLKEIAQVAKGSYFLLNNPEPVAQNIATAIDEMEQKNLGASVFTDYQTFYQYFIAIALLLLVIDVFIAGAKSVNEKSIA